MFIRSAPIEAGCIGGDDFEPAVLCKGVSSFTPLACLFGKLDAILKWFPLAVDHRFLQTSPSSHRCTISGHRSGINA